MVSGDPQRSAGIRDAVLAGLQDGTLRTRRRRRGGRVALVGGGPGDPGLITVRGRQLLAEADVVVADRLAPRALLDELGPDVELVDAGKIPRGRAMTQEDINSLLVERARRDWPWSGSRAVTRSCSAAAARKCWPAWPAGVPVTVVPGVTSAVGVPGAAGIPVTHRGITQEFRVVSAHLPPDDPRSTVDWAELADIPGHAGAADGPGAPESRWRRR